jgi:FkbM family methyltransferase
MGLVSGTDLRAWVGSVRAVDRPLAALLALCWTRPSIARLIKRVVPQLRIHPAGLGGLWTAIDPLQPAQFAVYDEVFVQRVYDLGRLAFEPDLVIDGGAFEGYFSLLARARFPRVPIIAFEPDPANFEGLRGHAAQRRGLDISVRRAALSTTDGEAGFAGGGCGGRLTETDATARVPVEDLRRVLTALAPQRLLLKLDIEGAEGQLLPALLSTLPRVCAIFFEWHQGRDAYSTVAARLDSAGFSTSVVREHTYDGALYIDAFAQRT